MQSYEDWAQERADPRFTDWLRGLVEPVWEQAVSHRFTRELADGTLDDEVFRRYIVEDYSFLDIFCTIIGFAIGHAPTLQDRIPLAQFLGLVTSEENTYFERTLDALGVPERDRTAPDLLPPTRGFHAVMREAAHSGHYEEIIAVLVVTEWLYLDWASRVSDRTPEKFYHAEWITIHSGEGFAGFVDWLRGQIDRDGPKLDTAGRARVVELFRRTVDLEKAFFDAAYG